MKVLVLSGRFGMGHEMAANAICEQFRKIDEQAEIEKKDLLEELYPHISKFIFGGFRMMVEHCYGIYNFIYKMSGRMKVEIQPRGKVKEDHGWRTTRCDRLYTSDVCKSNCIL